MMNVKNNMIEEKILELYKNPSYQKLNAYYGQSTVFNVLGIERNENRHSAFIAWLLHPESFHGLKETPLRKFLSLVASTYAKDENKTIDAQVREHLVVGNYSLKVECIETEQTIVGLARDNDKELDDSYKNDAKNRFDIWMLIKIKYFDANDKEQEWSLPVVIENKIYSSEGNYSDPEKAQTVRYCKAINTIFNAKKTQPLFIFLNTSDGKNPTSESFVRITYQDLLDYVILPCSFLATTLGSSIEAKILIDGYVRNLSCPSNKDGGKNKEYSILAIAETESNDLNEVFELDAFKTAFCAIYSKEAELLLPEKCMNQDLEDNRPILEQFWNNNEDLFKIVLYNKYKDDPEGKRKTAVDNIIKVSNRDNTRYFIERNGEKINKKPVPKSEASFLIFKTYCEMQNKKLSLKDLQEAFPVKLNSYYAGRFLNQLFHNVTEEGVLVDCGKYKGRFITIGSSWDFYWDEYHRLPIDGNVRSVKMWRKKDFDKLVEKARGYGINVIPAE